MKKKTTIALSIAGGVLVLGVVAATAGPLIYRDFIAAPAADAPSAELEDAAASTIDRDDIAGTWEVGTGSYAGYRVDEVLNGTDVTVTGRTDKVTGSIATTQEAVTEASITVDVASIATDEPNRDNYFRTQAIDTSAHPEATFTLGEEVPIATDADGSSPQRSEVSGTLSINGVSAQVTATVTTAVDGSVVKVAGDIPITFADFGVDAPSLGFVSVEDTGSVEFLIALQRP